MSGSIAHIKADRLIGVRFQSGYIRFYHLGGRNLVFELHIDTFYQTYLSGLQYLPRRRMIIANTPNAELKVWQYMEGEGRADQESTINTKATPYCIVADSNESQLIYYVYKQGNQCLETYNFHTNKTSIINLPREVKIVNCLISLGQRTLAAGDFNSPNICVLASRAHSNR